MYMYKNQTYTLSCTSPPPLSLSLSGTDLKKSRHVLKSLSLCNKVLSYLSHTHTHTTLKSNRSELVGVIQAEEMCFQS